MQRVCVGAIAAMACAFASGATAQDYPSRPIHVVIGFAAGSGADILTRFYANKLAEVSGQSTVVENRPGAVGIIAATVVAKAKPDGYTVLFSGNTIMAGGRHLVKDFPFDPDKDLVPAAAFLETPFVLAVSAKSGANSVAELVTLLKSKTRNKSAYTNPTGLLSTELFKMKTGIESESVSYKTTADAIPDLADGTLDFMILDGTFAVGQVKAGRIRALAATTNRRITALPDVPTMQEAGIPDYHFSPWWAAYVPAGTPPAIVAKIEGWVGAISKTPEAAKFLDTMAALPVIGDAEWVRARIARDRPLIDRLAQAANLQPQ
ncbi:MAG: tripartite tricarboxylate transporter substrate binding protein [Xanthobacteraceae bacterium]